MTRVEWINLAGLGAAVVAGATYVGYLNGQLEALNPRDSLRAIAEASESALNEIAEAIPAGSILTGAVVAFETDACPTGWAPYVQGSGRFIVGTGRHSLNDQYGAPLAEFAVGSTGGSRSHKLTVDEMPQHRHEYGYSSGNLSPQHVDYTPAEFGAKDQQALTSAVGQGIPHNTMPPYIALLLCTRLEDRP